MRVARQKGRHRDARASRARPRSRLYRTICPPSARRGPLCKTAVSGEVKWVLEQGQGVLSPEGELLALEGFVTDVTERVQARELLEVSNNVASTLELEPLLGLILDQLGAVVDYTDSSLLVFEGESWSRWATAGLLPRSRSWAPASRRSEVRSCERSSGAYSPSSSTTSAATLLWPGRTGRWWARSV